MFLLDCKLDNGIKGFIKSPPVNRLHQSNVASATNSRYEVSSYINRYSYFSVLLCLYSFRPSFNIQKFSPVPFLHPFLCFIIITLFFNSFIDNIENAFNITNNSNVIPSLLDIANLDRQNISPECRQHDSPHLKQDALNKCAKTVNEKRNVKKGNGVNRIISVGTRTDSNETIDAITVNDMQKCVESELGKQYPESNSNFNSVRAKVHEKNKIVSVGVRTDSNDLINAKTVNDEQKRGEYELSKRNPKSNYHSARAQTVNEKPHSQQAYDVTIIDEFFSNYAKKVNLSDLNLDIENQNEQSTQSNYDSVRAQTVNEKPHSQPAYDVTIIDEFFTNYAKDVNLIDLDLDVENQNELSTLSKIYTEFTNGMNINETNDESNSETENVQESNVSTVGGLDFCRDCIDETVENSTINNPVRRSSFNNYKKKYESYSGEQLCNLLDEKITDLQNTWEKPLFVKDTKLLYHNLSGEEMVDILEIHNNDKKVFNKDDLNILNAVKQKDIDRPYMYFDVAKYPALDDPFKNNTWIYLKNHIQAAALASGYSLFTNGGKRPYINLPHREFRCYKGKKYKKQSKLTEENSQRRKSSIINDRSRSRGRRGRKMSRRRSHDRPIKNTCHFHFFVCVDHVGYHIHNGKGCFTHRYHINHDKATNNISTRHLPKDIRNCIKYMNNSYANLGNMRNVIYKNTGSILSLPNISYMCKKMKEGSGDIQDELERNKSSVDKMITYFTEKRYDYYCLLQKNDVNIDQIINGISTDSNINRIMPDFIRHCSISEREDILKFIVEHRDDLLLTNAQHLMLAIAWVIPQEKRLFNLYPEVIFMDITSDTNKEKQTLFTITGKTASGTMYTILRAFLPNQKTWIFRWLFSIVLSNSFHRDTMSRCNAMITDGDSQETSQLDIAIREFFPNAERIRCGYHLNKKNWEKNGPKYMHYPENQKNSCSLQSSIISDWIYSWMKKTCETRLQYLSSKFLLLEYLDQENIIEDCGIDFINGVKRMIRNNIEPIEENYVYYKRKHIRHFGEYSNSAHEGTNHGLKHCADAVNPSHLLDVSSERLSFQGERNYDNFVSITDTNLEQHKSWNYLPCSKHLIVKGAALLLQEHEASDKYCHKRVSRNEILIKYSSNRKINDDSPVAQFANVRKLYLADNTIRCSCNMYEVDGIVCRHMFYIFNQINHVITHHDIDLRWWSYYAKYAFNLENGLDNIDFMLTVLRKKKLLGPKTQLSMFDAIAIDNEIPSSWIIDEENEVFCINHNIKITNDEIIQRTSVPFGLEQLSQISRDDASESSEEVEYINKDLRIGETAAEYRANKDPNKRIRPYAYLKDTFSTSCSTLQGLPYSFTIEFGEELRKLNQKYKKIAFELNIGESKGKIISSSLADSRKTKSDPCEYFKKTKKKRK